MKRIIASILVLMFSAAALAHCPQDRPYQCRDGGNGKQICSCGGW